MKTDEESPAQQSLTLLLLAPATLAVNLVIATPGSPMVTPIGNAVLYWGGAVIVNLVLRRVWAERLLEKSITLGLFWTALFVAPFAFEPMRRSIFAEGDTIEYLLLAAFRNLGLGLAALSARSTFLKTAGLVSLFLMLFASVLADSAVVSAMIAAYAIVASLWFMRVHWADLERQTPHAAQRALPIGFALGVAGALIALVLFVEVGGRRPAWLLAQLAPSSGGTKAESPHARGGVGDGENLVAAIKSAMSVGAVDSQIHLETHERSLDDIITETQGEPRKPNSQRSVNRVGRVKQDLHDPSQAKKAGREFVTLRETPRRDDRPKDTQASGVLYVEGPLPVHLALETFDSFDGLTWSAEMIGAGALGLQPTWGGWLGLPKPTVDIFAGSVEHRIKVIQLKTNRILAPSHLETFRLGQGYPADFFQSATEGILRLKGSDEDAIQVPPGSLISTRSRTVDPDKLARLVFPNHRHYAMPNYSALPEPAKPTRDYVSLARQWSAHHPRGWSQIDAIVQQLKTNYQLDHTYRLPDDEDPIGYFLFEAKRGRDYHFASAAALLLRALDYPTRFVSGFYVSPDRYDGWSKQALVQKEDSHFWLEVALPNGPWVTVEPTPGYEVLPPARSVWRRIAALIHASLSALVHHWTWITAIALAALAIYRVRRALVDTLATLWWRHAQPSDPRRLALLTLWLVETRARLAGRKRPVGETLTRWYGGLATTDPQLRATAASFLRWSHWALYAPDNDAPANNPARDLQEVEQSWTRKRLTETLTSA